MAVNLGAYDSRGVERAEAARRIVPSIAGGSRRLAGRRPVPRIFIGCKGRHLRSIKTLVSGAPARALPTRRNRALLTLLRVHYPFYPGDFQGRLLARVRRPAKCLLGVEQARERLEIYRLRSSVTPRKLGLTTLTGPNCFLPAIKILTCSPGSSGALYVS